MKNARAILVVSALALTGSLLSLLFTFAGLPPGTEAGVPREIGRALAQDALKLLAPGHKLFVIARDTAEFPQPAADLALVAFQKEIARAGAAVTAVQLLQVDPLRPLELPSGDFVELLRRGVAGDVIVSFMGPPLLSDEQRAAVAGSKAKVIAFCPGGFTDFVDLKKLAEQGLLHAAIISRPFKGQPARPLAEERFDTLYMRADLGGSARQ